MNWITKFIKPKIKSLFKKKTSTSEESLWISCKCKNLIYKDDFNKNYFCCPKCGSHHKLSCGQRFKLFFDDGAYEIIKTPVPSDDPLNFVDNKKYIDRLRDARKKTGQDDAVQIAKGKIKGIDVTVGAQDFRFIGGSFGAASGEAFIKSVQHAIDNKTPLIFFSCSGGQRMMESSIALMQMTRTTLAINELKKNNLPYIVCFTDPTAGGITASFAMLGDVHFAESGCLIAFAGKRVIQATVKEDLSADFQTAEFLEKHGFVDKVINRKDIPREIGKLLEILLKKNSEVNSELINETSTNITQPTKVAS